MYVDLKLAYPGYADVLDALCRAEGLTALEALPTGEYERNNVHGFLNIFGYNFTMQDLQSLIGRASPNMILQKLHQQFLQSRANFRQQASDIVRECLIRSGALTNSHLLLWLQVLKPPPPTMENIIAKFIRDANTHNVELDSESASGASRVFACFVEWLAEMGDGIVQVKFLHGGASRDVLQLPFSQLMVRLMRGVNHMSPTDVLGVKRIEAIHSGGVRGPWENFANSDVFRIQTCFGLMRVPEPPLAFTEIERTSAVNRYFSRDAIRSRLIKTFAHVPQRLHGQSELNVDGVLEIDIGYTGEPRVWGLSTSYNE